MSLYGGITLPGGADLDNIRLLDAMIIPTLNRMSRIGIAVDLPYLKELSVEFGAEMAALQKDIASYIPVDALDRFSKTAAAIEEEEGSASINASSAEQIRTLLFDLLKVGRNQTRLKSTATGKISTRRKNLSLVHNDHPVVPLVERYREKAKLKQSYCDNLPVLAKPHPVSACCPVCELAHVESTWRLHTDWLTTRAITGRIQCRKPPLQTIPIRSADGARIRAAFLAGAGKKLVSVDFAGMELRDLAHLANAKTFLRLFELGFDPHVDTAMKTFGISDPAKVDKYLHRLPAKRVNFGIQNGTTEKGLHAQLLTDYWASGITPPAWLTEDWCKQFIARWHEAHSDIQPYFNQQYYRARRYGFVWGPWGRTRYIPQVRSTHPYKVSEGLREAQNFAVTNSNAEQTKLAMAEIEDEFEQLRSNGVHAEALLSIHDQIIAEVAEEYAAPVGDLMVHVFEHVMDDRETGERLWRCPIKSDCEILDRWKTKD